MWDAEAEKEPKMTGSRDAFRASASLTALLSDFPLRSASLSPLTWYYRTPQPLWSLSRNFGHVGRRTTLFAHRLLPYYCGFCSLRQGHLIAT